MTITQQRQFVIALMLLTLLGGLLNGCATSPSENNRAFMATADESASVVTAGPAGNPQSSHPFLLLCFDESHRTIERMQLVGNYLLAVQRFYNTNDLNVYSNWVFDPGTNVGSGFFRVRRTPMP